MTQTSTSGITLPDAGEKIRIEDGRMVVPDHPILGFVEGDGIGPDIMTACQRIWNAAVEHAYGGDRQIHWAELFMGEKAAGNFDGDYFPEQTKRGLEEVIVSIKGPLTTPVGEGFRSLNVSLRQELDLYACVRPVRYFEGVPSPVREPEKVDVVIFRENTEDVYCGIEYKSGTPENEKVAAFLKNEMGAEFEEGAGIGIKPISRAGTRRLVRKAIQYALDNGRESVTLVHKGNIMKFTEGAFRNWGYELAREEFGDVTVTEEQLYKNHGGVVPEGQIVIKDRIADIMFQLMLLRPSEFDVLATMNLNGDYLSDAIAAEVGGVGIAPGANMADHVAVFEATHGTAPKYANLDKVNPGSLLFSGVMMLEYLGWRQAAELITAAYERTVMDKVVTYDFARQMEGATEVPTSGFATALIERMQDLDIVAIRAERKAKQEAERAALEAHRAKDPYRAMRDSGRTPRTVGALMTRQPISVASGTAVVDAMHLMREHGISSVLVEPDESGEWGIMTQRDIVSRVVYAKRSTASTRVDDIATRPLMTVPFDMSLYECSAQMMESGIRRLVVSDKGLPVGIVSDTDLFRTVDEFGWMTGE
jgi:isocitrate dehydrogenase